MPRVGSALLLAVVFAVVIMMSAATAQAQGVVSGVVTGATDGLGAGIDGIIGAFEGAVNAAAGNLLPIARGLLGALLLIELVITIGRIVVSGSDLGELFSTILKRVLIAGFYLWLMDTLPGFGGLNGLVGITAEALAGKGAGGEAITPSNLLSGTVATTASMLAAASYAQMIPVALISIVLIVLTALIVAMIVVVYVEVHVVFGLGVIAVGFAGFNGTEGVARGFLMSAIAKCLKLYSMLVLSSVFGSVFNSLGMGLLAGEAWGDMLVSSLMLVGGTVIMFMVVLTVPSALEQAVAGANAGGSSASGGAGSFMRGQAMKGGGKAVGMAGGVAGKLGGLAAKGAGAAGGAAWNASGGAKAASAMKARVSAALGRNS